MARDILGDDPVAVDAVEAFGQDFELERIGSWVLDMHPGFGQRTSPSIRPGIPPLSSRRPCSSG